MGGGGEESKLKILSLLPNIHEQNCEQLLVWASRKLEMPKPTTQNGGRERRRSKMKIITL